MFLGIDQSLRSTGVAVVGKDGESIYTGTVTPKKLVEAARLAFIREGIRDALAAEPGIKFAALEGYSMLSTHRAFDLGEVGAVVRLALHDAAIPFVVVPPLSLKQFVTGNGQAKKEDVRHAVYRKWGIDIDQDDECDAFGLAQVARSFHLNTGKTRSELEVVKKLRDPKRRTLAVVPSLGLSL